MNVTVIQGMIKLITKQIDFGKKISMHCPSPQNHEPILMLVFFLDPPIVMFPQKLTNSKLQARTSIFPAFTEDDGVMQYNPLSHLMGMENQFLGQTLSSVVSVEEQQVCCINFHGN